MIRRPPESPLFPYGSLCGSVHVLELQRERSGLTAVGDARRVRAAHERAVGGAADVAGVEGDDHWAAVGDRDLGGAAVVVVVHRGRAHCRTPVTWHSRLPSAA